MEKVRPWCGQPSDRGRLKNRISQVIGCEDRLRNDLYCVEWGVKLYSNQSPLHSGMIYFLQSIKWLKIMRLTLLADRKAAWRPSRCVILYIDLLSRYAQATGLLDADILYTRIHARGRFLIRMQLYLRENIVSVVTTKSKRKWADSNRTACVRVRVLATMRALYVLRMFYLKKIFLVISVGPSISW